MENKIYNILVLDDHPLNSDAYINLIKSGNKIKNSNFLKAIDCQSAFKIITQLEKTNEFLDVVLLDINIPSYQQEKLFSGADIAHLIRIKFPKCIIIMLTMHLEPLLLHNVHKQILPEGFISKNDIDFESFNEIFNGILNQENYYSKSIKIALHSYLFKTLNWDVLDTQIILFLNQGILTKDLPNYIKLSLSAIEKRKAALKRQMLDKETSDLALIKECKKLKLI